MPDLTDEYHIIAAAAGWIERSDRGRVRLSGKDAGSFLQSLVTNDVAALQAGEGRYAAYLTPAGRMLADLAIYRRPDEWILGLTADHSSAIAGRLDQLIFTEDVQVSDATRSLAEFSVVGGQAGPLIAAALGLSEPALAGLVELAQADWQDGFVARAGDARFPIYSIIVPAARRDELADAFGRARLTEVSPALMEALRIEAGRPRFGADLTEDTIPLEAGLLDRAISTAKGCYVGQEIIIRILHRGGGRVAKRLVTLAFDPPAGGLPPAGTPLLAGDKPVGALTSVSRSPASPSVIALGYVHRDHAEPGQQVVVGDTGATAKITGFAG
jgi:folate-binding protein YgfZ